LVLLYIDTNTGIRIGIGSSIFQIAGAVCSDPSAMTFLLSGVYVLATSCIGYGIVVYNPAAPYPNLALLGIMMLGTFAATVLAPYAA
jgi:hypothetical protein